MRSGFTSRRGVKLLSIIGLLLSFAIPLAQADIAPRLLSTTARDAEPWTMALFGSALIFLSVLVRRVHPYAEK